ncbi:MAG: type II secretion system protein [Gemmatales bacterium]
MRRGITLVETLVVIAIIALVMSLIVPAIMMARESANVIADKNKLRNVIFSTQLVANDRNGILPKLKSVFPELLSNLEAGDENTDRFSTIDILISTNDPNQLKASFSSIAANAQVFAGTKRLPASIHDGVSYTIGFIERYSYFESNGMGRHNYCWGRELPGLIYNSDLTPDLFQHRPTFADNGPDVWNNDSKEFRNKNSRFAYLH